MRIEEADHHAAGCAARGPPRGKTRSGCFCHPRDNDAHVPAAASGRFFLRLLASQSPPVQQLLFPTRTAQTRMNTGYGVESAREANRENSEERG